MSNYPDLSGRGYEILSQLGQNNLGGRMTYRALDHSTQQNVVIKQFQISGSANWKATAMEAYEQEVLALRHLNHSGIPRYLDSWETSSGFCLVQEYIDAQSLAVPRNWQLEELKQVALSVLEILTYLQSQTPPIIHRDIKPENILIDNQNQVYLVDFGFARVGKGEIAASSMVKGTMGFMAPEQLFNRELTPASDLYGLGVTLICLLTGINSGEIGNLIDADYQIHFRHLIPPVERGWLSWLEKMVEPSRKNRYQSAQEARRALKPIAVKQLPRVRLERDKIELKASQWQETVINTFKVTNPIPNTLLSGRWEVAAHVGDPPHTPYEHSWIEITPRKLEGNEVQCQIEVDTSQLLAEKSYKRQLLFHSNSNPETYAIALQVETAPLPKPTKIKDEGLFLLLVLVCSLTIGVYFHIPTILIVLVLLRLIYIFFIHPFTLIIIILLSFASIIIGRFKPLIIKSVFVLFKKIQFLKEAQYIVLLTAGLGFSLGTVWIPWLLETIAMKYFTFLSSSPKLILEFWSLAGISLISFAIISGILFNNLVIKPRKRKQRIEHYHRQKSQLIQQ